MEILLFTDVNGAIGFGRYAGAYKIGSELRRAGFSVQVVDFFASFSWQQIRAIIDKFVEGETLMVAFASTMFSNPADPTNLFPHERSMIQEMFSLIKQRNSSTKIVVGGHRVYRTNFEGVDFWVRGAGELSVVELARHLRGGHAVQGSKAEAGTVITSTHYPYNEFTQSRITWANNDWIFEDEHLPLEIERGCILHCDFCNYSHNGKRRGQLLKGAEMLRDELTANYSQRGTRGYWFCDANYNADNQKVEQMHAMLSSLPFSIEWSAFGNIESIIGHPEQKTLLLESGARSLLFGIETFSSKARKSISKNGNIEKVKDTLHDLKATWGNRVAIGATFIVGLPGESEAEVWETVEWLMRDDSPVDCSMFFPLNIMPEVDSGNPDIGISKIAREPAKYGYKLVEHGDVQRGFSNEGPDWKNDCMDKNLAIKVCSEVQRKMIHRQGVTPFPFYSQLRNLGYDSAELSHLRCDDARFFADAANKRAELQRCYWNRLMV